MLPALLPVDTGPCYCKVWLNPEIVFLETNRYRLMVLQENNRSNGEIWEYSDEHLIDYYFGVIPAVIASEKAIVRHEGENGVFDRTMTSAEKAALQNVLDAYVALGGVLPEQ